MGKNQDELEQFYARMKDDRRRTWIKAIVQSCLWFALSFLAVWGLGAEPAVAARVAVFPMTITFVTIGVAGLCMSAIVWFAHRVAFEDAELERLRELYEPDEL